MGNTKQTSKRSKTPSQVSGVENWSATLERIETAIRIDGVTEFLPAHIHASAFAQCVHEHQDLILVLDETGKCNSANQTACLLLDLDSENSVGRRASEFFPPHCISFIDEATKRVLQGQRQDAFEIELDTLLGKRKLSTQVNAYRGPGETVAGAILVARDITEICEIQERRELAIRRFECLTEQCPIPVFQADVDGNCIYVNPALKSFYGLSASELLGNSLSRFIHPEDIGGVVHEVDRRHSEGQPKPSTWRVLLPKGQVRHVEGYSLPVCGSNGSIDSYISCFVDVTDHIQIQQRLKSFNRELEVRVAQRTLELSQLNMHLNEMIQQQQQFQILLEVKQQQLAHSARVSTLGELASGLTHELNQPLQAATNYLSVMDQLSTKHSLPPEFGTVVKSLRGEIVRASEIIRRTRQFVRPITNQMTEFEFSAILDDTLAILKHELLARKIKVSFESRHNEQSEGRTLRADAIQVQQVLVNLIKNAMDAIDPDSPSRTITVKTGAEKGVVSIEIIDPGIGVKPEDVDRLFTPFFTTKENGLGLGLSISRSIIEQHGGTLRYSAGPSTFRIELPVHTVEFAPPVIDRTRNLLRSGESPLC